MLERIIGTKDVRNLRTNRDFLMVTVRMHTSLLLGANALFAFTSLVGIVWGLIPGAIAPYAFNHPAIFFSIGGIILGLATLVSAGLFVLFIISVSLTRLFGAEMGQLNFTQRIIRQAKEYTYLKFIVKQAISLANVALLIGPTVLIVFIFASSWILFTGNSSDFDVMPLWLNTAGSWGVTVGGFASGILAIGFTILCFLVWIVNGKFKNITSRRFFIVGSALILSANLVGFLGVVMVALSANNLGVLYTIIAVFAAVGVLALAALLAMGARMLMQRTPPSASEIGA